MYPWVALPPKSLYSIYTGQGLNANNQSFHQFYSPTISVDLCLFSYYHHALGYHYELVHLAVFVGHVQTISAGVEQVFLQLALSLGYHVYHHFKLDPFLCARKSNATNAFLQHLIVFVYHHLLLYIRKQELDQINCLLQKHRMNWAHKWIVKLEPNECCIWFQ